MPSVTVEVSEDMMFATIVKLSDASKMDDETHVSLEGTVRKVTYTRVHFTTIHTLFIHKTCIVLIKEITEFYTFIILKEYLY